MKVLITGGAGFIGSNAASRYLNARHKVVVIDNLSRPGAASNVAWLRAQGDLELSETDISNDRRVRDVFRRHADADRVLHLAGQVAVTTSVKNPRQDFEDNAFGTFNVLEAMRLESMEAPLVYSSTNKVYGEMTDVGIVEKNGRYTYATLPDGVSETRNLDFHSPYGCSKGTADQYVIDYHRIYGLRTTVMRQSCIYGYRQFGMEDQGWVAWFMIASLLGRPITVYGDGKQVRDVLFIEDLLDAYDAAFAAGQNAWGRAFNVGGGPANTVSLLELLDHIGKRRGRKLQFDFADWRPGDQKVFVSDISRAKAELGWQPRIGVHEGLDQLYNWISANISLFEQAAVAVA